MSITVALKHRTSYAYDRLVGLAPHVVRLRPAPHSRTPIQSYSMKVEPEGFFLNWQQDAFSNWQGRLVFPEKIRRLDVTIDLVVTLVSINPFDFFLQEDCREVPFNYEKSLEADLQPYLKEVEGGKAFKKFLKGAPKPEGVTIDWIVALNQYVQEAIDYTVRLEPGVQTPTETIEKALGSCRDSSWLLVAMMRHFGYAARFVSGYLIQLSSDQKSVDGPSGPEEDFTDLHAWCEVYLPGAGWVGLDPTSGLFASEGHIPLAATPEPSSAAPITGAHDEAEVEFEHEMSVTRIAEPPRVTRPISPGQWAEIDRAGQEIDRKIQAQDMRLTMGGEPTFVSAYDRDSAEWLTDAVGPTKREKADMLIRKLQEKFAPEGVLHHGQGKWYPGEPLPRWAFSLLWRGDRKPLWTAPERIAKEGTNTATQADVEVFSKALATALEIEPDYAQPVFEDPMEFLGREGQLPENVTVEDNKLDDPQERTRLRKVFERGLSKPTGYVIPIQMAQTKMQGKREFRWASQRWTTRRGRIYAIAGDSPVGFRLPLGSLQRVPEIRQFQRDPMVRRADDAGRRLSQSAQDAAPGPAQDVGEAKSTRDIQSSEDWLASGETRFWQDGDPVRTALAIEERDGALHVFYPPTGSIEEYIDLLQAVQETAETLNLDVRNEGYEPPKDDRVNVIRVTPDPGVIEVNIHPAHSWNELRDIQDVLYEEARQCGLDSVTFMIDGRLTGSGGGNHIVVGGATPADSPFLRRPDMLASVIRYWQAHPSLSYMFSGLFIGPTSQAPRFDEGRPEAVYEMELAMGELDRMQDLGWSQPWLVDRIFRHLLTDMTGNTHRAEICIDKMFSPDGPTGRLGLVEFRGFEMPPHFHMSMAQALVLRGLLSMFWDTPFKGGMQDWRTALHDKYMLPSFLRGDFNKILEDLSRAHGFSFQPDWFDAQYEFRFPSAGETEVEGVKIALRNAIEPWLVLGEEQGSGGTARYVDSSVERLEVALTDMDEARYTLTCNGYAVPLTRAPSGDLVAGVRFRAWQPWSALHPTIGSHGPLVFDLYDRFNGRSVGGCVYHIAHQGGLSHEFRPINALEAEGRRLARFEEGGHTPGNASSPKFKGVHPAFPHTLDLRRS